MAVSSYESVVECVEAEISLCEQMARTLAEERSALARLSYVDLNSCIRQRRLIEAEWRSLARQRRTHLARLLPGKASLGELARQAPQAERERLSRLRERLAGLITTVKREQRINLALVRSALSLVGATLKLVRGEEEPRYDANAALVGSAGCAAARWRA